MFHVTDAFTYFHLDNQQNTSFDWEDSNFSSNLLHPALHNPHTLQYSSLRCVHCIVMHLCSCEGPGGMLFHFTVYLYIQCIYKYILNLNFPYSCTWEAMTQTLLKHWSIFKHELFQNACSLKKTTDSSTSHHDLLYVFVVFVWVMFSRFKHTEFKIIFHYISLQTLVLQHFATQLFLLLYKCLASYRFCVMVCFSATLKTSYRTGWPSVT